MVNSRSGKQFHPSGFQTFDKIASCSTRKQLNGILELALTPQTEDLETEGDTLVIMRR